MRLIVALAALALSGSIDLAAASACKPPSSHLSSATSELIPSDTTSAAATSETGRSITIKSVIEGGGFSVVPPEGGVPGFTVEGEAEILIGPGYKGDGSQDGGCLSMKARNVEQQKRDIGTFAGVSQALEQLSLTKPYTVRFFYLVITAPSLNLCQLTASLGGQTFYQTWIFSSGTAIQWGMALEQVTAAQSSASLSISMNCLVGGTAQIYVDSLFMSNQVTPATIDDHPLDLGGVSGDSGLTTSPSLPGTTTSNQHETTSAAPVVSTSHEGSDSHTIGHQTTNAEPTSTLTHESATSDAEATQSEQVGTETDAEATSQPYSQTGTDDGSQTLSLDDTVSSSQLNTHATPTGSETQEPTMAHTGSTGPETQAYTSKESMPSDSATQDPLSTEPHSALSDKPTATETESIGAETDTPSTIPSTSAGSSSSRETSTLKPDGPVSRVCANVGQSTIAGRGCGMRPYNSAGSYTRFTSSNYQLEDCAALCLADTNCKSFEWSYNSNCFNECRLISSPLSDVLSGNSGAQFTSYDRSCIIPKPCYQYPDDSICINKMADTPNRGCLRRRGTLKSCAKEFATLTVQPCGGGDQCRDMCSMYPDCQSFSYTSLKQQGNCKLFSGTTNEITEEGGSEYFSDIGCFACGKNMGFSTYALPIDDVVILPDMTCRAPTQQLPDTPTTLQTRTSQAVEHTTSQAVTAITTKEQPTTTKASPSSTSAVKICPSGIAAPGFCKAKENLPTQTVSLPGILDHWPQSDNDIEPAVQRTCNAFGNKKGGWRGYTLQYNPRQNTMEDCALLCRQAGNCEAFGLDNVDEPGVTQCALTTYKLATEGIDIGSAYSIMWSDLDCYECEECVAE
ncbi:uncharacterized protein FTOL_06632 [Fusarium torulosum]|uniref:Apple domain-containing protein n=1 Tax=Fusarium torulosum TaxID=33205 RepID=A0AAE8MA68_9HYPO|nr:uncharacterized protein FTOL_06632 [Fusarium torulosum]